MVTNVKPSGNPANTSQFHKGRGRKFEYNFCRKVLTHCLKVLLTIANILGKSLLTSASVLILFLKKQFFY